MIRWLRECGYTGPVSYGTDKLTFICKEMNVAPPSGPATQHDIDAGYEACMWCEETGDSWNHASHDVLWDRELEMRNI